MQLTTKQDLTLHTIKGNLSPVHRQMLMKLIHEIYELGRADQKEQDDDEFVVKAREYLLGKDIKV